MGPSQGDKKALHDIRRQRFCGALVVFGITLLAGCGGSGGGGGSATPTAPSLSASVPTPIGLTAQLAEDRATVPVGGTVAYTMTLTNNTGQAITYLPVLFAGNTPTPQTGSSLQVLGPTGQTVFAAGSGFDASSAGPAVTVAPGQSVSASVPGVNTFAAAGRYTATAVFVVKASSSSAAQATTVGPLAIAVQ